MSIPKIASKLVGDKKRWRQYKARTRELPDSYLAAVEALERYLMVFGPTDGGSAASMFEDVYKDMPEHLRRQRQSLGI